MVCQLRTKVLESDLRVVGPFLPSSDFISSGEDDCISSGYWFDRINGDPDDNRIFPSGNVRDFNVDRIDCGAGVGDQVSIYSYDDDIIHLIVKPIQILFYKLVIHVLLHKA